MALPLEGVDETCQRQTCRRVLANSRGLRGSGALETLGGEMRGVAHTGIQQSPNGREGGLGRNTRRRDHALRGGRYMFNMEANQIHCYHSPHTSRWSCC